MLGPSLDLLEHLSPDLMEATEPLPDTSVCNSAPHNSRLKSEGLVQQKQHQQLIGCQTEDTYPAPPSWLQTSGRSQWGSRRRNSRWRWR